MPGAPFHSLYIRPKHARCTRLAHANERAVFVRLRLRRFDVGVIALLCSGGNCAPSAFAHSARSEVRKAEQCADAQRADHDHHQRLRGIEGDVG